MAALAAWLLAAPAAAQEAGVLRVAAVTAPDVDAWEARIARMVDSGELQPLGAQRDTLLPGRRHERYTQTVEGVPVLGAELVRQVVPGAPGDAHGRTVSVFGALRPGIALDTRPVLGPDEALRAVEGRVGAPLVRHTAPELAVLPLPGADPVLAYRVRAFAGLEPRLYVVDARTGVVVREWSDLQTQAAVGLGTGVLRDTKKVSVAQRGGAYLAEDLLRPPRLRTFDLRGDVYRTVGFLLGQEELGDGDLARDADNQWTDGANVDAHAYTGWVYDFYFRRFGRRGLDDADLPVRSLVHPVRREDYFVWPDYITRVFYGNAAYFGGGVVVYGEGLPAGVTEDGLTFDYMAGGLEVVAHELTHGVTEHSSRLEYHDEPGALNEAFSDVMGTAVEFFFQAPGSGPLRADYVLGEDVIGPAGLRSLADPMALGNPDHYSTRYRGEADSGGVHINSTIASHAFFLAIEGGTNRTSGITVRGVGGGRREEIEKAFYRAFSFLLYPSADFAAARAATLQAARDLQGPGSTAEEALAQAWTAVGVP